MKRNLAELPDSEAGLLSTVNQIINACAEAKGQDIKVLDVSSMFDMADYFVVASGRSDRQVQGIANRALDALSTLGVTPVSVEGLEEGHWVLIDAGDIVLHVFYEPLREHYDIEGLWNKARRLQIKNCRRQGASMLRAA